jgi:arylsulfatase A-like enzyme
MEFGRRLVAGLFGGVIGGALVGLGEAVVVAAVSDASEFWVFVFGTCSYAVFGGVMGLGWAVVASVLPFDRERNAVLATAGGLVAASLGLVVGRFRIVRDVFSESLPLFSTAGILVHVGLIVGAIAVYFLLSRALRTSANARGVPAVGLRWTATIFVTALVVAVGLNAVAGRVKPSALRAPTAKGPDVMLIIVDTLRADHIGAYGATDVKTPAIDSLARDGVVFEHAFADSSWTRPSIATILTSLYPSSHQVMHKTDLLPDAVTTLAEAMSKGGYRTAGIVTNINIAPSFNFQQGFDSYRYLAPDFFFGATDSGSKLSLYSGMRLIRERFLAKKKYVNNYYQDAKTVGETALPWLEHDPAQPFFSLIHYMDPHDPYFEIPYDGRAVARVETPHPSPDRAPELRRLYVSDIEYFDGFLGRLLADLHRLGLYDDMVIALVADHGEEFYEHGGWWHGTTLYDEAVHVPLIVKLPGNVNAGSRHQELARLLDVMPTLLARAGVAVPPAAQGRDLFGGGPAPQAVYAEEDHEGNELHSVRTRDWKLIVANPGNPRGLAPEELYDLRSDPKEKHNVAGSNADELGALKADLASLRKAAASSAVAGESGELDDASKARLKALGYMEDE